MAKNTKKLRLVRLRRGFAMSLLLPPVVLHHPFSIA